MSNPLSWRALRVSNRHVRKRSLWRTAGCVAVVCVATAAQSLADRGPNPPAEVAVSASPAMSSEMVAERPAVETGTTGRRAPNGLKTRTAFKQPSGERSLFDNPRDKKPVPSPPKSPAPAKSKDKEPSKSGAPSKPHAEAVCTSVIQHGVEVGPATVGLSAAGVNRKSLKKVSPGKASVLANGVDPESGRPMLTKLHIDGGLTIDVPCVVDRCLVTKAGGFYAIRNLDVVDWELRDSEVHAVTSADGKVPIAAILHPRVVRRCIVTGGQDGLRLAGVRGCLIEDTWVYGQEYITRAHNDCIQGAKAQGDWDTYVFLRCRVEGPWQRQTSALMLQADRGDMSGMTVRDCFLSGGTYTLYSRAKPGYTISKIRVIGNVFADKSWKFGPFSNEAADLEFSGNSIAPVKNPNGNPLEVDLSEERPFTR